MLILLVLFEFLISLKGWLGPADFYIFVDSQHYIKLLFWQLLKLCSPIQNKCLLLKVTTDVPSCLLYCFCRKGGKLPRKRHLFLHHGL